MAVIMDMVYQGSLRCVATHGPSRQQLSTDAPVDNGGRGEAFSPTDLVATGLGTCVMTIMALVGQRNGLDLTGLKVQVTKEMTSVPVRRIAALQVAVNYPPNLTLSGLTRAKLEQAALACPVKQSLHPEVQVTITFS